MPETIAGEMNKRLHVPLVLQNTAMEHLRAELQRRLTRKGSGTFASRHELLGILEEEMLEVKLAVHNSPLSAQVRHRQDPHKLKYKEHFNQDGNTLRAELLDLAVACVFGVACIDADTLSW
jgi:hypothetical protein